MSNKERAPASAQKGEGDPRPWAALSQGRLRKPRRADDIVGGTPQKTRLLGGPLAQRHLAGGLRDLNRTQPPNPARSPCSSLLGSAHGSLQTQPGDWNKLGGMATGADRAVNVRRSITICHARDYMAL